MIHDPVNKPPHASNNSLVGRQLVIVAIGATLAVLWPLLAGPSNRSIATWSGDNYHNFWNLWWVHKALIGGGDIFFTHLMYFPMGTSLSFTDFGPVYGLLSLPAFLLFPGPNLPVLLHNVWVAATFVFTVVTVSRFCFWAGASSTGSAVAGLLASFNTYRLHHVEHLNLLSIFWLPLLAQEIGETAWGSDSRRIGLDSPDSPTNLLADRWRWLRHLLIGFGLGGTSTTILYLGGMLIVLWTGAALLVRQPCRPIRLGILVAGLTAGSIIWIWPWFLAPHPSGWESTTVNRWSPDLAGFFWPSDRTVLGGLLGPVAPQFHGAAGNELYIGLAPMLLFALGWWNKNRILRSLLVASAFAFLLALGTAPSLFNRPLDLPMSVYSLVRSTIPIAGAMRATSRFLLLATVLAAPILAVGWDRMSGRGHSLLWGSILAGLFLMDTFPVHWRAEKVEIPAIYQILRDDPAPGAVIEITYRGRLTNQDVFHQTIHRRPIVGGTIPFPFPNPFKLERELDPYGRLSRQETCGAAMNDLAHAGVAFLVLHRGTASDSEWNAVSATYCQTATTMFSDDHLAAFRLRELSGER